MRTLYVLAILIGALTFAWSLAAVKQTEESKPLATVSIPKDKYDAVTEGDSYESVVSSFGSDPQEMDKKSANNLTIIMAKWHIMPGKTIYMTFKNNQLESKGFTGLQW